MRNAVIFDMDGLLIDSERVALLTFQETCQTLDIPFNQALYDRCIGTTMARTEEILCTGIPSFPIEAFRKHWGFLYHEQAVNKPVPVKPGVKDFLNWLEKSNIPCAVATSTRLSTARAKLTNADLIHHFSVLMTGDQVENGKPHPEIYLTTAAKLGFDPKDCLALEDSDNGVRAAHAANMLVFQIPDLVSPSQEVLKLGHSVLPSMSHVHDLFRG